MVFISVDLKSVGLKTKKTQVRQELGIRGAGRQRQMHMFVPLLATKSQL